MKKRITQILFSLLTFCTNTDIYAQENEQKIKSSWSSSVSLNYDFTNNFTGNVNLGYTQKNWELFLDYSGHSDRIEISSELFRSFSAETSQVLETEQHHLSHSIALQLDMKPSSRNLFLWNLKLQFPKITTNRDISNIVSACNGNTVVFEVKRNDTTFTVNVLPQKSAAQDSYKVGLWVRDSTAGIGTITYFNPQTGHFAGLGHGISDVDTGVLMPLAVGDVIGANISSVIKGQKGAPGQLEGSFNEFVQYGSLIQNTSQGVFGKTNDKNLLSQQAIPIASNDEVQVGEVTIRCTTNGSEISEYKAMIESINKSSTSQGKNMVIKITDEALLEKTGGIVQGMSGSPIIQNGKLVGAVTHVLINDPTMGYGIFIENMLAIDSQNAA